MNGEDWAGLTALLLFVILPAGFFITGFVIFDVLKRDQEDNMNWMLMWLWPITWFLASPIILIGVFIGILKGFKYFGKYLGNVGSLYKEVISK